MKVAQEQRAVGELLAPDITELLEAKETAAARGALLDLLDAEVAEVLVALEPRHRAVAFRLLPRDRAPEVFAYFDQGEQEQLVESLTGEQAAAIFNAMDPDDRVNFFEDAPEELAARMLALMHPAERAETEKILEYPPESVGRLMTPEYLTVHHDWTVAQALEHIRRHGRDAETINTLFVVDAGGRLTNHVSLRKLILADPGGRVSDTLQENIETVRLIATDDRESAVRAMEKYDLPVVPVVTPDGVMAGIVTFDDVADVAEEEVTEDVQKMGGMAALETPYLSATLPELIHKRGVWLSILLIGESLTILALSRFQSEIDKVVALALLMPVVMASGGNSGSQAASLVIRAMAVGDLTLRDWWRVIRRELLSGVCMGSLLGLLGVGVVLVFDALGLVDFQGHAGLMAATILAALIGVVTCGTLVGSMLPFVLRRLGLDPAAGSTPMVATLVDVTGLVIYFSIALVVLRGTLL